MPYLLRVPTIGIKLVKSPAAVSQLNMKSIVVLCALVGLASAVPPTFGKVELSALCQSINAYFNVLAKHVDFDAVVFGNPGKENMTITVNFKPNMVSLETCVLVNTSNAVGLKFALQDSLLVSVNGVSYTVSACQVKLQYVVYHSGNFVHMDVSVAQVLSLGQIKSGDKDFTLYGETFFKPYLNDAFNEYATKNWSFKVNLTNIDRSYAGKAIKALLEGALLKIADSYL